MSSHGFVGDLLIRDGVVDASGLALGLDAQSQHPATLGRALEGLGLAAEGAVASAIASGLHLEYVDGDPPEVREAVAALLTADFCQKRGIAPISFDGTVLRVAVIDPMDYSAQQDAQFRTGKKIVAVVVTQTWLEEMLRRLYPDGGRAASYDMLDAVVKPVGEVEAPSEIEYDLVDPA